MITGMSFEKNNEDLLECLKKQNKCIEQGEIKILKQYAVQKNNKTYYNAILEVDEEHFSSALKIEKVSIGWEKCKVYDGVDVTRCFKCKGYNHKSLECKNEETCSRCFGKHKTSECKDDLKNKCINCIRANEKFNLGLYDSHVYTSKQCPVYIRHLTAKKIKIGY